MELDGARWRSMEITGDHVLLERLLLLRAPTELSLGKATEEALRMLPREPVGREQRCDEHLHALWKSRRRVADAPTRTCGEGAAL